ncbi:MATE family efflux transporter [Blautia sp. Sow4_E7]|uniref:MATE family efflux transporter n=1 Tax=Blautia sp. Sow4_E7 TaxID=3438749 RepID=UPI003F935D37
MSNKKEKNTTFTEGKILQPLILFALPVLFALFLQAMYGAVDLLIVGKFASSADVSAVSTGSQIMMTLTNLVSSFAMGTTVLLGQQIGCGDRKKGGETVGTAIILFAAIAVIMTVILVIFAPQISGIMNAPTEAFDKTVNYVRICGSGMLVIIAYNLIGCIFRGLGDSRTPLVTVAIACVCNIAGDLLLCAGFRMGTEGAAFATVFAQVISVVISFWLISRKSLPFELHRENIRINRNLLKKMTGLGAPIALQDLLVSISFLIILAIVNSMGVTASAGVGVAEKVCAFIMLISSAFMQSISAFVAQNYGAGRMDRAKKALYCGICVSFAIGVVMFFLSFFHGDLLAGIFSSDPEVIAAAVQYLKAYGIDCLFTAIFFCYTGFYNGIGMTRFVMIQGIVGAFGVRVPFSYFMSKQSWATLFHIGLATPFSSVLQLILCVGCMLYLKKKRRV